MLFASVGYIHTEKDRSYTVVCYMEYVYGALYTLRPGRCYARFHRTIKLPFDLSENVLYL